MFGMGDVTGKPKADNGLMSPQPYSGEINSAVSSISTNPLPKRPFHSVHCCSGSFSFLCFSLSNLCKFQFPVPLHCRRLILSPIYRLTSIGCLQYDRVE